MIGLGQSIKQTSAEQLSSFALVEATSGFEHLE
jgi:hypothetical protein